MISHVLEYHLTYGSKGSVLHKDNSCPRAQGQSGGAFFTLDQAKIVLANKDAIACPCVLVPVRY